MAFSSATKRKEVKKSSYYVWFLGAKESRGLRGEEYVWPAVHYLTERENDVEPVKVTLQVSGKGLKIIQNVSRAPHGAKGGKSETSKHFVPDHSITFVVQDARPNDDVVAAILLIFNPVSKCPVHVHAYRCDSVETATLLRQHLQSLVERPDNQRKFQELERRLRAKGLLPPPTPSTCVTPARLNSDGRSTRTESDSSGGGSGSERDIYALDERVATLYDSLAAELREKLNNEKNNGPLLLPPRDYDAASRARGNLDDVEKRRSLQRHLATGTGRRAPAVSSAGGELDSSGKSSGIGSDEAPGSPTHERSRRNPPTAEDGRPVDCSSDEEWERHRRRSRRRDAEPSTTRNHAGRSPSPPSSMHPPSPKPPPYRERYYEGERANEAHGPYRRDGAPSRYPDYATHHSAKSRTAAPPAEGYDRPLRRVKSRGEQEQTPSVRRDVGSHRLRTDRDVCDGRDPPTTTSHHPQISHSRSYDLLTERAVPHRYHGDRWTPDSYDDTRRCTKSATPITSSSSKTLQPDSNGYVPLPRVRRVDSGHSSAKTHHSGGMRPSVTGLDAYQELPDEKRYPGLDRDTSRLHHQHHYASSKIRDHDQQGAQDARERERSRYDRTTEHSGVTRASPMPYGHSERPRRDEATVPSVHHGVPEHSPIDNKRFYRYGSLDPDSHHGGRRMAAATHQY